MGFEVLITEDFDRMSEAAARILIPQMRVTTVDRKEWFNLGLPTGNSPTGLYQRLADRQDQFDATKIRSWNLDEYVGLPGETPSERVLHPESYGFCMIKHLFGKLHPPFAETHVPLGTEIDQEKLERALKEASDYVTFEGKDKGKAIIIQPQCQHKYLRWIQDGLLAPYPASISAAGGIAYWVVGVGGRGHLAFHESGIPLDRNILLVKLDENTVKNAVDDDHFKSRDEAPWYSISMGAGGVVRYSQNALLLANGERKTEPIAASLLGPQTDDVTISIFQRYIYSTKNAIYVLDEIAAKGILGKKEQKRLAEKGITVRDLRV